MKDKKKIIDMIYEIYQIKLSIQELEQMIVIINGY